MLASAAVSVRMYPAEYIRIPCDKTFSELRD